MLKMSLDCDKKKDCYCGCMNISMLFLVNRMNQEFACEPPMLVYTRTPPTCASRHIEPAEFISKECKIAQAKGVGKELVLGGGQFDVRLKLGIQDVDIISTLDLSDLADILDVGDLF